MQKIVKLLIDFQRISKRKRLRTFMEISGYPHYENVCSNILKFFFQTNNEHNLSDLLLKSLIQTCELEIDTDYEFRNVIVKREIPTLKKNRLDLLIETDEFVIGIENKIFHFLHNDLSDYSNTIDNKAKLTKKKTIKIVLSLGKVNNSKIQENEFINITYPDFFKNIQNNLGDYILTSNSDYLTHLKGFMTTLNNLSGNNMENKELNLFFEQNAKTISELTSEFDKYKSEIFGKIYQLNELIEKDKYASKAEKQWIYDKRCLVHDYLISNEYRVSVDTYINLNGWEIQLFGRNPKSTEFIFNVMFRSIDSIGKSIENYRIAKGNRLIFAEFKISEIEMVADTLIELLGRIEKYKENNTTQQSM